MAVHVEIATSTATARRRLVDMTWPYGRRPRDPDGSGASPPQIAISIGDSVNQYALPMGTGGGRSGLHRTAGRLYSGMG